MADFSIKGLSKENVRSALDRLKDELDHALVENLAGRLDKGQFGALHEIFSENFYFDGVLSQEFKRMNQELFGPTGL